MPAFIVGSPHSRMAGCAAVEAELVRLDGPIPLAIRPDLDDSRRAERRDLVETWRPMHHECVRGLEGAQRRGHQREALGIGHPDDLAPDSRGVGQGADEVHEGRNAQLAPDRRDVSHRRMHRGREHEHDPRVGEDAGHDGNWCIERNPERFEQIRTAAA